MIKKYHNEYRVKSTRLDGWDYSSSGYYFITISVRDRINYFGRVMGGTVELSDLGRITKECWKNIPMHFPHVGLDEFVVMPSHVHGIIIINSNIHVETQNFASPNPLPSMETQNLASLHPIVSVNTQNLASRNNKFGPQSKNLGSIIRGFKIGVKKWATMNNIDFQWQPGFYEHIIRNEKSLQSIRQYIIENPLKWEFDLENLDAKPVETQNLASKTLRLKPCV
ncbi:MAG: transposase [Candidatus Omnitrophota bacterium]